VTGKPKTGEFERIARFFAPLSKPESGAFSLSDDAAVLDLSAGHRLVAASDTLVEGVHFFGDDPAADIALKLLAVNLSDFAAMGACPKTYLLNIALPDSIDDNWLKAFSSGLAQGQGQYRVTLVGGDSVSTHGPLTLSLTLLGEIPEGRELRRSGARDGDLIFVSGTIGDAALGVKLRRGMLDGLVDEDRAWLLERYLRPIPRLALGRALSGLASAAIDISDGLVSDLMHICRASGLAAELAAPAVPLSDGGRAALEADPALVETVLTGGDDYELLFAVPQDRAGEIGPLASKLDLPLTRIGHFRAGEGVRVIDAMGDEIEIPSPGYRHF